MSTAYWEGINYATFPTALTGAGDAQWKETQCLVEITHQIGLLQELLYYSPDLTSDLIRSRRYEPILHRLKPELDSLWQYLGHGMADYDVLNESVAGMEDEEIREIRMRFEVDYVRLYANAISMRGAHARIIHRLKAMGPAVDQARPLAATVLRWAEAAFIVEAVSAAVSLLKAGIALHRRKVLRYCPGRTFLRIMFASVFLMKAMSFGAILQAEVDVGELQHEIIKAFREAAIDEGHLGAQLASLLSRLFPQEQQEEAVDPLAFLDFDLGSIDVSSLGDYAADPTVQQNIIGCNPNGLVSVIEGILDGGWAPTAVDSSV